VVRTSLVDFVVERLRTLIESGLLKSGDPVPPEAELGAQLGVSRTVVREAVKRLQTVGLVTVRRGIGTYVAGPHELANCIQLMRTAMTLSAGELVRLIEFREALEVYAARQAAHLATPADVAALESLCKGLEDERQDFAATMQVDLKLHLRMVEICGNPLMRSALEILQEFILEGMRRTRPQPQQWPLSKRIHKAMIDAIRNGDANAAETAIREHMRLLIRRLHRLGPSSGKTAHHKIQQGARS
jgi:GntR family transcriptional regulator, transcriptional repressor for pyruvate dehydrogenase complex